MSKAGDYLSKRFDCVKTKWRIVQKQSINGVCASNLRSKTLIKEAYFEIGYASLSEQKYSKTCKQRKEFEYSLQKILISLYQV